MSTVRDKIGDLLPVWARKWEWEEKQCTTGALKAAFADAILAIPELVVKAESQTLPEIPSFAYDGREYRELLRRGAINYSKLLSDWVKVEKKP